jgi:hypothetical protein
MRNYRKHKAQENMPVILVGDFNVNVKDNYNAELVKFMKDIFELVKFMKDIFELDVLLDLCQGTTRSNSCIDMVFG